MKYDISNTHSRTPFGFYTDVPPSQADLDRGNVALSPAYRVLPKKTIWNIEIPDAVAETLKLNKFLKLKKSTADSVKKAERQRATWNDAVLANQEPEFKTPAPVQSRYKQYSDDDETMSADAE